MRFTVKKGSEKGSQKGFWEGGFQKVPRTPCRRARPLRRAPCSYAKFSLPYQWHRNSSEAKQYDYQMNYLQNYRQPVDPVVPPGPVRQDNDKKRQLGNFVPRWRIAVFLDILFLLSLSCAIGSVRIGSTVLKITKAKIKFGVKYLCSHECERSSVVININMKAKATNIFGWK